MTVIMGSLTSCIHGALMLSHHSLFHHYRVENKQLVVRCRWTEESIQIDDDLGRKRCGAGGMKDGQPGIIVHDQGVLLQSFGTVRAAFRETLNSCPKTLLVGEDEHDVLPLSFDLSPTRVVGDLREKYTSLALYDCSLRWLVLPQRTSAKIRTPGLDQVSSGDLCSAEPGETGLSAKTALQLQKTRAALSPQPGTKNVITPRWRLLSPQSESEG